MSAAQAMPVALVGFTMIAVFTWLLSFHPRMFVKIFVPNEEYRDAIRSILRNQIFRRDMRRMAYLQFEIAVVFGIAAILFWFA